jgi:hypothetical protein
MCRPILFDSRGIRIRYALGLSHTNGRQGNGEGHKGGNYTNPVSVHDGILLLSLRLFAEITPAKSVIGLTRYNEVSGEFAFLGGILREVITAPSCAQEESVFQLLLYSRHVLKTEDSRVRCIFLVTRQAANEHSADCPFHVAWNRASTSVKKRSVGYRCKSLNLLLLWDFRVRRNLFLAPVGSLKASEPPIPP